MRLLQIFFFIGCSLCSFGQQSNIIIEHYFSDENGKKSNKSYDIIEGPNEFGLYMVGSDIVKDLVEINGYKSGKFGICDKYGNVIVPQEYDNIVWLNYSNKDFYICKKNNKYGLIDLKGRVFRQPDMESIEIIDENCWIGKNSKGKCGLLDFKNNVILDFVYLSIEKIWGENLLLVENENGYGLYSVDGKKIINHEYDLISKVEANSKSYFIAKKGFNDILLDENGKKVFDKYKNLNLLSYYNFTDNNRLDFFSFSKAGKIGVISIDGKVILDPVYDAVELISVKNTKYFLVTQKQQQFILDLKGKPTSKNKYGSMSSNVWNDYLIVSNKGTWSEGLGSGDRYFLPETYQLVNIEGKPVLPFDFISSNNVSVSNSEYLIINRNNAFGVIDQNLKSVIGFEYNMIEYAENNLFIACKGAISDNSGFPDLSTADWGVIDINGAIHIPFEYETIEKDYAGNLGYIIKKDGKQGWINLSNKRIIIQPQYESVLSIDDNYVIGKLDDKTNELVYGIIDGRYGETIVEPKYNFVGKPLYQNYYIVKNENNLFGFLNEKGDLISNEWHHYLGPFYENYFITNIGGEVYDANVFEGYFGIIDSKEKTLLSNDYRSIDFFVENYAKNDSLLLIESKNDKKLLYNLRKKQFLFKEEYEDIQSVNNFQLFIVKNNELKGVIKPNGKVVLPTAYSEIFCNGKYLIGVDSLMGKSSLFDLEGNSILQDYMSISFIIDSLLLVSKDNKFNIYNANTRKNLLSKNYNNLELYEYLEYTFMPTFSGKIIYETDGKKGIMDCDGKILIDPVYIDIQPIDKNYFIAGTAPGSKGQTTKWGIVRTNSEIILPFDYESVRNDIEYFLCIKNGKEIKIDRFGEEIK